MKKWHAIAAVVLAAVLQRRQLRLWRQSAARVAARSVITDRKTRVALRSSAGLFSIVGFPVARSLI